MAKEARTCQTCKGLIPAYTTAFTLQLRMFAEAGPLDITPDDLAEDHQRRMEELVKEMEDENPQELMDQVFESYTLTICPKCRTEFHGNFQQYLAQSKDEI
jgi:hypothetical protein